MPISHATFGSGPESGDGKPSKTAWEEDHEGTNVHDHTDADSGGTLTPAAHNHSGADITSGTVVDARIDAAIARDSEIVATKLDDFATPDDNTDLNATTSQHGLLPKLGGGSTNYLRADGTWDAPGGTGAVATDSIWDAAGDLAQGTGANTATKLSAGTAGHVLTSAGAAAAVVWAPMGFDFFQFFPQSGVPTATVGTWANVQFTAEDTYPFGGFALACTSGAQDDAISYAIALNAGTWAVDYIVRRSTNTGIITLKIDGSSVGTIDTYVTPGGHIASGSVTGITVATAGAKTLQLLMATKNASSSAYAAGIFSLTFRRTA